MSNAILTLAVVVMAIATSLAIAVNEPDQPATLRTRRRRDQPSVPDPSTPDSAGGQARGRLLVADTWVLVDPMADRHRARSGTALAVMVACLGAAVALTIIIATAVGWVAVQRLFG